MAEWSEIGPELLEALKYILPMVSAPHSYTLADVWRAQERASVVIARAEEISDAD